MSDRERLQTERLIALLEKLQRQEADLTECRALLLQVCEWLETGLSYMGTVEGLREWYDANRPDEGET